MDEKMKKLNDDDLEIVSGGSHPQNLDLANYLKMGQYDKNQILSLLNKNYGIYARINDGSRSNYYLDINSGEEMTHDEVIARLKNPNISDPADSYLQLFLSRMGL